MNHIVKHTTSWVTESLPKISTKFLTIYKFRTLNHLIKIEESAIKVENNFKKESSCRDWNKHTYRCGVMVTDHEWYNGNQAKVVTMGKILSSF